MLNVGKIENGIVLDHIEAGKAMLIYHYLHLDREDYQVAIIKNARSNDMGRKDILKVECDPDTISLDAVALIEPNTTVNIIKGGISSSWQIPGARSIAADTARRNIPPASARNGSAEAEKRNLKGLPADY